jgi:glycosyltransferase involved in cell wall biosynthesis
LIRTGDDYIALFPEPIEEVDQYIVNLGRVRGMDDVARVLSTSDILVQPGRSDQFNDYRFPSKLPEFFAAGRPVLLPNTNVGSIIQDGKDAVVLKRGDAIEIADQIVRLRCDPDLSKHLATNARRFAHTNFSWPPITEKVLSFYNQILATTTN